MKWGIFFLLITISFAALCNPADSSRMVERQKLKIEKKAKRMSRKWDERSFQQKRTDRRILLFMAISSIVLVNTIAIKE